MTILKRLERLEKIGNIATQQFKPVPDTWYEFASLCKIRSGDKIVNFNPFEYQKTFIEQVEKHQTTIVVKTRQLGYTATISNYFLWNAIKNEGYLGIILSKTQQDTSQIARRLRLTIENLTDYCSTKTDNLQDIEFKNGGRILFRNSNINSCRGLDSVNSILLDESAFIDDISQIYASTVPCTAMVGDKAKIIILSTPNTVTDWYFEKLNTANKDRDILQICDDIKQEKIEPTQYWTDDNGWLKFISHWLAVPKYYVKKDTYLDEIRRQFELPIDTINREFNLSFTSSDSAVFSNELIKSVCVGGWEKDIQPDFKNNAYYLGLDNSLLGLDYTVLTVIKSDSKGKLYLVDIYKKRKQSSEYNLFHISEMITKYEPVAVGIETNSSGQLYYENLVKKHPNVTIKGVFTSSQSKPVMINRLALCLENRTLTLPNDKDLISEFLSFRRNGEKLEAMNGKHDDTIMSICMALSTINRL